MTSTGEFDRIRALLGALTPSGPDALLVPPGDDAALLTTIERPVISTDAQVENVHFKCEWMTYQEIGRRAAAAALSDLAASFATPVAMFVNLAHPAELSVAGCESIYTGIDEILTATGCVMGGGNLTKSDQLSLNMFVIGEGCKNGYPLRGNAKKGEGVYVTGPIGASAAGLHSFINNTDCPQSLKQAFISPSPRFDAASLLAKHGVACAIDISDGLSGDAAHVAVASDISIQAVDFSHNLPRNLHTYCRSQNLSVLEMAEAGGEDYELLFTCSPALFLQISKELPSAFQVGICTEKGAKPFQGISRRDVSHDHFRRS